jgi:hypothetical protein
VNRMGADTKSKSGNQSRPTQSQDAMEKGQKQVTNEKQSAVRPTQSLSLNHDRRKVKVVVEKEKNPPCSSAEER